MHESNDRIKYATNRVNGIAKPAQVTPILEQ